MNKFIGIGRNTKDGKYSKSQNGVSVYSNCLAMTNTFKNKDGNYDSEFINYVAYRQVADFLNKYSQKGTQIVIDGRITTRSYEAQDGSKKYVTEISVENANILEKKQQDPQQDDQVNEQQLSQLNAKTQYDEDSDVQLDEDDYPF